MFRFATLLVLIGGILLLAGVKSARLASVAKEQPQTLTCAELAAHGPGGNAHVRLTDFYLAYLTYVKVQPPGAAEWSAVYLPAVPLQGEYHRKVLEQIDPHTGAVVGQPPVPGDLGVLVRCTTAKSEEDIKSLAGRDTIEGVVINGFDPPPPQVMTTLGQTFAGVDLSKVWVLDHGRTPPSATRGYIMLALGAALVLIALGLGATAVMAGEEADQPPTPETPPEAPPDAPPEAPPDAPPHGPPASPSDESVSSS